MNIVHMPCLYPDELLYSLFARFYAHSGYLTYRSVAEILFEDFRGQPNMEFVTRISPETQAILCRNSDWESIIMEHTMLPYYCRFLDVSRRQRAYQMVFDMKGGYSEALGIPKQQSGTKAYLRYCPICSSEDRKRYGETYWHRCHQIDGIFVCAIHGCRLHNSTVSRRGKQTPTLYNAEEHSLIQEHFMGSEIERRLAEYINNCINMPVDMNNDVYVGELLLSRMEEMKYVSVRGEQRRVTQFIEDIQSFYSELTGSEQISSWKLEKILKGYRRNPIEIFQIAFFLSITAEELVNPILPFNNQSQLFNRIVEARITNGDSIRKVAKETGVSTRTIQLTCKQLNIRSAYQKNMEGSNTSKFNEKIDNERMYWLNVIRDNPGRSFTQLCAMEHYRKRLMWLRQNDKEWTDNHWPLRTSIQFNKAEWDNIDIDTLPLVESAIKDLKGTEKVKPRQVTKYAVAKILGLPDRRLELLPRCTKMILENTESKESYWAHEIVWAIQYMIKNGVALNYKHLRDITNMRRSDYTRAYPDFVLIADNELIAVYEQIMGMNNAFDKL
ncbi:TniQ protein [Anaerosporobacter mobilis DSM 15930]|uniref:TniQ protein n=1 Tax=Anaerosporobacter mobilis DSM 15930 TaxID=1120996 RepID=A0A1M7NBA3_9FIRM|nr:TnsD family Tn7-like transposition protein [Anaerosporobacter mobilis]SHN00761.1 TniQ protein [Anaerosporobacter mobilis DSM 15930]